MSAPYQHETLKPCIACKSLSIRLVGYRSLASGRWAVVLQCRECALKIESSNVDFLRASTDAFAEWNSLKVAA